jgi:membrane protease YdiL (CAAX protease family)
MALQGLFGLIATFSPAIVALIISSIANPAPILPRSRSRWIVFIGAWLISAAAIVLHTWQVRGVPLAGQVIIPSAIVALLPAWLISCSHSRIPGVRELFGTILRPRGDVIWYLIAFLTVPAVQAVGAGITLLTGGEVTGSLSEMSISGAIVLISLTFLQGFLVSGGINEETGWRGFVLPRLQARYPVLVAAAIVWFFWALWHIPYDLGNNTPLESILFNRIVLNFIWAVLFVWVYNRTRGSLLAPAIFHPAMNTFGEFLPRSGVATVLFIILVIIVIVSERMWKKLPDHDPAVIATHPKQNDTKYK